MKKTITNLTKILTVSSFMLAVSTKSSYAIDTESSNSSPEDRQAKREELKQNVQDNKQAVQEQWEENKAQIQANRQEVQENRQQNRAEFAHRHAQRLQNRFQIYYQRLSTIINKMHNRYQLMLDNGKNVTEAVAKLNDAEIALEAAKSSGDEAINKFNSIEADNWDTQKDIALSAVDLANQARTDFKQVQTLLKESIILAKELITNDQGE